MAAIRPYIIEEVPVGGTIDHESRSEIISVFELKKKSTDRGMARLLTSIYRSPTVFELWRSKHICEFMVDKHADAGWSSTAAWSS